MDCEHDGKERSNDWKNVLAGVLKARSLEDVPPSATGPVMFIQGPGWVLHQAIITSAPIAKPSWIARPAKRRRGLWRKDMVAFSEIDSLLSGETETKFVYRI